jgi:hypothetical protein
MTDESTAVGDLLAYGQGMSTDALIARDREQYQFWQGWTAALERVCGRSSTTPTITASSGRSDVPRGAVPSVDAARADGPRPRVDPTPAVTAAEHRSGTRDERELATQIFSERYRGGELQLAVDMALRFRRVANAAHKDVTRRVNGWRSEDE